MKQISAAIGLLLMGMTAATATAATVTLDLTKATTPMEFDKTNGAWTGTYNDDEEVIESQSFIFIHSSMGGYKTWWGFTASNSDDNTRPDDTTTYQFSNMAKGGIVLNEDGSVKTDEHGMPVTSADVPYIVGYYNAYMSQRPCSMIFNDGNDYEPQSVYVNLNSYAYYSVEYGDSFARQFSNGDKFTLTIHGVSPDGSESTVDVPLASYTNGDLTINRGWKLVDLKPLGVVNELYFTMDSTDSGKYGMNTPGYFCLDKLTAKKAVSTSVSDIDSTAARISYDRASHMVTIEGAEFAMIYDATGTAVMSGEQQKFNISDLPAGAYIVRAGNSSLKIAK